MVRKPRSTHVAAMQRGRVANLDAELALDAGKISFETKLPMVDSAILHTGHGLRL